MGLCKRAFNCKMQFTVDAQNCKECLMLGGLLKRVFNFKMQSRVVT